MHNTTWLLWFCSSDHCWLLTDTKLALNYTISFVSCLCQSLPLSPPHCLLPVPHPHIPWHLCSELTQFEFPTGGEVQQANMSRYFFIVNNLLIRTRLGLGTRLTKYPSIHLGRIYRAWPGYPVFSFARRRTEKLENGVGSFEKGGYWWRWYVQNRIRNIRRRGCHTDVWLHAAQRGFSPWNLRLW